MDGLGVLVGMGIGIMFLIIIICIVLYVLKSLGLYGMAQKAGFENSWLAWIPVGDTYIMGKLIGKLNLFGKEIPRMEAVLPIGYLVVIFLGNVDGIGSLLSLAYFILMAASLYTIFKKYKGDKAVVMTILSIILAFMGPIFLFNLRNADPIEPFDRNPPINKEDNNI